MSTTIIPESCADSDLHPAVLELIEDERFNWFGSRHPDDDAKETITAEAFSGILTRVARRAYAVGRAADPAPSVANIVEETHVEDSLWKLDALCNGISALVRDRDFAIEPDSIHRLVIIAQRIVHELLPESGE